MSKLPPPTQLQKEKVEKFYWQQTLQPTKFEKKKTNEVVRTRNKQKKQQLYLSFVEEEGR